MIVLGNSEFATGMRFCGIGNSHIVRTREEGVEFVKCLERDEFIIANVSVIELIPELKEFENLVSVPDSPKEFGSIEDLNEIIKKAVGMELNMDD